MNILVSVEGFRRPRLQMDSAVSMGRSMDQDRYIYQWPQCDNMTCGKSPREVREALASGCMKHENGDDFISADSGVLEYPLDGQQYQNHEKCIWQIRPESTNKFIKFKVTRFDTEYDQYCGMDKLHIYSDVPENFGGRRNTNQNRVARICGGPSGPKFQQHNFFDAVGALSRFADNTCPLNNSNRRHRKCKIQGADEFFEIDHEIMTLVFETDQSSNGHHGFRIEWSVYDRPDPTPAPPSNIPANVLTQWTDRKLTHNLWGVFRFASTYITCTDEQVRNGQCHNRNKIEKARRAKHRFVEAKQLLSHTQNYQPRGCVKTTAILPQNFKDEQLRLVGNNRDPTRMEDTLRLWYDTMEWRMADCTSNNAQQDLQRVTQKLNRIMWEVFQRQNVF